MDSGPYVIGNRLNGLAQQLQLVASNMANANSTGYKRTVNSFVGELRRAASTPSAAGSLPTVRPVWPRLEEPRLDLSQGTVRKTGRPLDVAIQGQAFLEVATPQGTRYTRKGRLYRNPRGDLVDGAGNQYMGEGGSLNIPEDGGRISIRSDGEVLTDDQSVGTLRLVDIPQPNALVPVGAGMYRNDGPPAGTTVESTLIQGAVEESNVRPMDEMVSLLQVMRSYEAGARLLRKMDRAGSDLINTAA